MLCAREALQPLSDPQLLPSIILLLTTLYVIFCVDVPVTCLSQVWQISITREMNSVIMKKNKNINTSL